MAAEVMVTAEQQHAAFAESWDETRSLRRHMREAEGRIRVQGQTIEDLLAGSVALSDSQDDTDAELRAEREKLNMANGEIMALWERDREKDQALHAMAVKMQEMGEMLRALAGWRADAVETIAGIMAAA